jgi:glutamate-1-semialdehyde aminotransferase
MFFMHFADSPINNYESAHSSDEKKGRMRDALLQTHGVNMPAFHSDFASLPMDKADLVLFESALQTTLGDMKKLGAI